MKNISILLVNGKLIFFEKKKKKMIPGYIQYKNKGF